MSVFPPTNMPNFFTEGTSAPRVAEGAFDRTAVLNGAGQAVADRGLNYGKPEDNFGRIAALWRSHLGNREACEITAVDVAIMLALVKVARLGNDPTHKDSWVDLAGYAACGGEVALKKA